MSKEQVDEIKILQGFLGVGSIAMPLPILI